MTEVAVAKMAVEEEVASLKATRKKANQKCHDRCEQVEQIVENINDIDLESEDMVLWLKATRETIKIKDIDGHQA